MKRSISLIVLVIGFLFLSKPAFAAGTERCETQYGGTQVCITTGQVQINKEVFDPQNKKYVDNLGINDYKFSPGELISFRLSIKNVGNTNLNNVTVSDTPQTGFLDLATGALNFNLTNLAPGEIRQQELKLRVVDTSKLPQNNIICIINTAETTSDNNHDKDTAQICLEKKVLAVITPTTEAPKELPKTGPEGLLLALFGSFSGIAAGTRLIRFGRIKYGTGSEYHITEDMIFKKGRGC